MLSARALLASHSVTSRPLRAPHARAIITQLAGRCHRSYIPTVHHTKLAMRPAPALALLMLIGGACAQVRYLGKEIGELSALQHGVRGTVYAVDSRTIYINNFYYDGQGPAAYFYMGTSASPRLGAGALRLRDERGGAGPLRKYTREDITLTLPDGKTLKDFRWFSVYCDQYEVNFGDVSIPRGLEYPRPAKVSGLKGVHAVSSDPIVIVDAQTILVPNFSYDGEAPDAKFWVGRGDRPSPQGIRIPDENGKEAPLRRYDKKTIVLTLPGELTVFDIGHFAVWCEAFTVNFGHVVLPAPALRNVPPSLKMLGVSPQSKLNCEVLYDELAFEVRWAVAGDSIVVQLVAKLEDGEYMSFGISGDSSTTQMVGGDVTVAWVDKGTLKGYAVDYYLDAKSQCAGVRGSCPDDVLVDNTNSVRLLNAALVNGYSIVTYQRLLRAADELDRPVLTNTSQPVIWAIGPLNSKNQVSYHSQYTKNDKLLEFGRPPVWNCPMPEDDEEPPAAPTRGSGHHQHSHAHKHSDDPNHDHNRDHINDHKHHHSVIKPNPVPSPAPVPKVQPWSIPAIQCYEPPDGVFYAQMGPTGGKQGYSAITGHVGWGISWYINGLLIPEINVVRGRKYTFVVEGGSDPAVPARYHPFYITDDPVGGYFHKTEDEKKEVKIFAGVRHTRNGDVTPTGVGRLCNWTPDPKGPPVDEYPSFGAYQRALTLVCEEGNPGVVTWVPNKNTPNTVYYQCFTHRHLGWKINVLDECDLTDSAESRVVEKVLEPEDMVSQESVQVQTRVSPDKNFIDERKKIEKIINTKTNYDNFSSFKDSSGLTGEVYPDAEAPYGKEYESPISNGQMKEVIQAVETLEHKMKEDLNKNASQNQVREEVKDVFLPEQPVREDDEYTFETGKIPQSYFLTPDQKPLTLQSVLRPTTPNKMKGTDHHHRPQFRRPVPPEIKLRRPPPQMYMKGGYPLSMPNHHNVYSPTKKSQSKIVVNRSPPTMGRLPPPMDRLPLPPSRMPSVPPMKSMPPQYPQQHPPQHSSKPNYHQITKLMPKPSSTPQGQVQSIIMGKPSLTQPTLPIPSTSQKLNLGQTDIIANHVVKSQIMLPGGNDAVAQHSTIQTYLNVPGQIILGKPMDNPMPLDQQMIPTKQYGIQTPSTPVPVFLQSTPTIIVTPENNQPSQNEIKSSDFIGESADASSFPPAVNTGFKPDSIVVESGFKPIIREPLMAAEDRIADEYEVVSSNRREDTDVEEDYEESPQYISTKPKLSSERLTETFEPMFIPSPEDHLLTTHDITKEVFPTNHAKEDRPHPVYVKTKNELNALFSKKNVEKEVPSDLVMESDRVSPHYLPPDPKLPKEHSQKLTNDQTFTTYDGKTVSGTTLTSVVDGKTPKLFSAKLPANTEQLLKTPQFGPFKGEIPPPVAEHINTDSKSKLNTRTTNSKLVNRQASDENYDEPAGEELTSKPTENDLKPTEEPEEYDDTEEYEEDQIEENSKRVKRESKAATYDRGQVEEVSQTNGHSKPVNQVEFETTTPNAAASNIRLYWMTHLVLLIVCVRLL